MKFSVSVLIAWLIFCTNSKAQYDAVSDGDLQKLIQTKFQHSPEAKLEAENELLVRHIPGEPFFDSLLNNMISDAETSRDRGLMCMAYNYLSEAYISYPNKKGNAEQSKVYTDRCMQIANEAGLEKYKTAAFIQYSKYYNWHSQNQKALDYNNQALALATMLGDDSLLAEAYAAIADTWDNLSNKLSQFQALLSFRDFAEKSTSHLLILQSYDRLAIFYRNLGEYEKAKDLYTMMMDKGRAWGYWAKVIDGMRGMGKVFVLQGNEKLGLPYGTKALALADSIKMPIYKITVYIDLLNYYLNSNDPGQGLAYIKSTPVIMDFINKLGIQYEIDKVNAYVLYTNKKYDSALYLMQRAAPDYYTKTAFQNKYNFTVLWSRMLNAAGRHTDELQKLLLAKGFADTAASLDAQEDICGMLYEYYDTAGNYKEAIKYYRQMHVYKDSLESLGKQKDLLTVEIGNTNRRMERQKAEEEDALRVRNNLQYMGITAAIATVFIFLVLLGVFRMSESVIKALGFFAFIFLFEFIILLLDYQIHELTHGEPWKVLAIKIVIIGILLPLHHKMEERVTHYLTNKAYRLRDGLSFKKKEGEE
jgi:tetratricopeptide (TPR) repeat protein